MSARELITEHLDLWTGAVTKKSSSGRGSNGKVELTGVKKLRELILELALLGKLVKAEESDEPAHQLLSKIESEKSRLAAEKVIKKPKKLEAASGGEPYQVPSNWCWVRLGQVTNYGVTDKAEPNQVADNTWVLELEDIEKESSKLLNKVRYTERQFRSSKNRFERGDVLYGKLRPYLDKVLVADEPGVCTTEIIPIRGYLGLLPEFLRLALKSPSFRRYANDSTHGMNLPRLGTDKARLAMIPLPPEREQHRIVQKVDELMALCDRLEQQTSDQLEAHETLVDTLLGTLTQSENATELADNWARLAAHFDALLTTEQSIDKLKQTILQLAVTGRLVKRDVGDEPASELLNSVTAERRELVQSGKVRAPKIPANTDLQISPPFPLPRNWNWVRLGELFAIVTDGDHQAPPKSEEGVPFLVIGNLNTGRIDFAGCKHVNENYYSQLDWSRKPTNGDLLYTVTGSYGIPIKVLTCKAFCVQRHVAILRATASTPRDYVKLVLESEYGQFYADEIATGIAQKTVPLTGLRKMPIPLPPQAEQYRIVQKVDELMALCDQLKERLNQASETRCQLAESIVEGALS
ncbi:restriction endonuclease subunit S [Marinobacter fonticola]|uniref:restriction endonuclease subunit S n=1 Tax=Marinobacter fonticola TaxID=2603215 RepID=UPI0011E6683E|nr:restriction endonuclease subunit S [Marinobacter fonticola]